MSLTTILKKIEKIDRKHREIQQRYNSSSKGCPRQVELEQQSQEDQRIYGYSNSQILNLFKKCSNSNLGETRPTTAQPYIKLSTHHAHINQQTTNNIRRVFSATKPVVCYKEQYNFLFKEDIFDNNHQKNKKNAIFRQLNKNNQRLSQKFKNVLKKSWRRGQPEATLQQKRHFVESFEQNLQNMKNNSQQKLILNKKSSKQIIYGRREEKKVQKHNSDQYVQLFKLTKPEFRHYLHTFQIKLTQSVNNIQEINPFLYKIYQPIINMEDKRSMLPFENFYKQLIKKLPQKCTITFLAVPTLKSVKFNVMVKNDQLLVFETRHLLDLQYLVDSLLNQHGFMHICLHHSKELIYEVFMLGKNLLQSQIVQNEILLLSYYLQRFLLLDKKTSIKVAQQTSNIIFRSKIDIPDKFFDFITSLKDKCCHFYDKQSRYYTLRVKDIIGNGIKAVKELKKELGLSQKAVKLKKSTKKDMKNYIYNWAYFYICFSISSHNSYLFRKTLYFIFEVLILVDLQMKAQKNQSVKVALRVRPLNKRETTMNSPLCIQTKENILTIKKQNDAKDFVFDYVFGIETRQHQVYQNCGYSLVQNALEGFNGTVFAYGQTGAGKTFTMVGDYKDPDWKGIIPRGFDHVITAIQTSQNKKYIVRASFVEIYNEDIYDLLDAKGDVKKDLKQSPQTGVFIKDLKSVPVKSVDQMFNLLDYGNGNRSVAKTNMNATSSRSHALFTVHIQSLENGDKVKASKLNFVDLAGSQRQGKTGATGDTLKEGAKINLSLTALGNVINALVQSKKGGHIPYRDSKLTRLLQDSLGGNTKTLMIASVSPALDNYDETLSTLRYAARARNIKNTPKINEDPKDALIKQYLQEIQKLKKQLASGGISTQVTESSEELEQYLEKAKQKEKQLTQKEAEILEMKLKMKEMEQLIMKKEKDTPEIQEKAKKRRLQKKKIMKNEELNEFKVHDIEAAQQKDLEETEAQEGKDITYWKNLAKRLKKKLKNQVQDKKDQSQEFEDQRQRLNQCIRNLQGNLSFYKQISQKFLSESDLAALKDASTFDFQKRQFNIPPFLLHDQKLTLPKTLKKHEVDDLWKEKRKGYKLQLLSQQLPTLQNNSTLKIPENKSTVFNKTSTEFSGPTTPFLRNRRILKVINPDDEKYKQKNYETQASRQTFFRRTNFLIRESSNSQNKRTPSQSNRLNSKTKLQPLGRDKSKDAPSQESRPISRDRQKFNPLIKRQ